MTSVDLKIDSYEPLIRNLDCCIWNMGVTENCKNNKYSTDDGHWSVEGHMKASKLIEKFINERYN